MILPILLFFSMIIYDIHEFFGVFNEDVSEAFSDKKEHKYDIMKQMEIKCLVQDFERLQKCKQEFVEEVYFFPVSDSVEVINRKRMVIFFHLLF